MEEEDLTCLIRAAYAPELRPSPEGYERMFEQWVEGSHARRSPSDFPAAVLVVLGVFVLAAAAQQVLRFADLGCCVFRGPEVLLVVTIIVAVCNVLCVPVAAVRLVLERKKLCLDNG